jgi:hypothetical protein
MICKRCESRMVKNGTYMKNGERRHGLPGQSAWLVHPKHGEFNRINFSL